MCKEFNIVCKKKSCSGENAAMSISCSGRNGAGLVVVVVAVVVVVVEVVVFAGSLFYLRCRIDVVALLQNKNSCSSLIRLLLLLLS